MSITHPRLQLQAEKGRLHLYSGRHGHPQAGARCRLCPAVLGKPQADEKEFIPVKLAASGNPKVKNRHVFFRGRRYTFRKFTYIIRTFS